jgi:hypothetical protein
MTVRVMTERDWSKLRRIHVNHGLHWGDSAGTDFWLYPGVELTGATTFLDSSTGWTTTSTGLTAGTGADFMASADKGTPRSAVANAQNDLVVSPAIFGDYQHARVAQLIMGERTLPRYLIMDALAGFSVGSTSSEENTAFGFLEAGGSGTTAADHFAAIASDGTNFVGRSGADSDVGAAIDTAQHLWRLILDRGSATSGAISNGAEWFIDGTSQGTFDIQADLSPSAFIIAQGGATNRVEVGFVHIYYEWNLANLDSLTA